MYVKSVFLLLDNGSLSFVCDRGNMHTKMSEHQGE